MSDQKPLWKPDHLEHSAVFQLQTKLGLEDYKQLHEWSTTNPGQFWSQAWDDLELVGDKGQREFVAGSDFLSWRFFPDAQLNAAENLLAKGEPNDIAIISVTESGERRQVTWGELRGHVAAAAAALRQLGVQTGDRIAAWTPNNVEVVIFALAGLSIGATISTASPDFAPSAVADRFGQIEPKVLLSTTSYSYNGKVIDCSERANEINSLLPSLIKTIPIPEFFNWIAPHQGSKLTFTRLPFDHPGFVLFSSGTTGKPKCIVHAAAGVLLKAGSEHLYHFDIKPKQRVFFFTTCGWMMWNWLIMALARGATIILYDGSPSYPKFDRLFDLADAESIEFFGVSAKFIDSCHKEGLTPAKTHNLKSIRIIGSTGSVLSPESFDYIYQDVKRDVHLASLSGGTDICGCFVAGVPTLPVWRGEIQGPCLGMAMDVFDDQGRSAAAGEKGELVCTVPFPSKPLYFWADEEDAKYRSAYFEGFPGVWTHGDFAAKTEHGGYILYGRSDATLNSKGVRIGTAEIYRVVETFPEIQESMAVSQDWDGDTRVVLFVVMRPEAQLTADLEQSIRAALRTQASPRHVPEKIVVASALPRTKSNKLVELAVTDVINGRQIRNRDALANPEALDWFRSRPELQVD